MKRGISCTVLILLLSVFLTSCIPIPFVKKPPTPVLSNPNSYDEGTSEAQSTSAPSSDGFDSSDYGDGGETQITSDGLVSFSFPPDWERNTPTKSETLWMYTDSGLGFASFTYDRSDYADGMSVDHFLQTVVLDGYENEMNDVSDGDISDIQLNDEPAAQATLQGTLSSGVKQTYVCTASEDDTYFYFFLFYGKPSVVASYGDGFNDILSTCKFLE